MRIKQIQMAWFRGAAGEVKLQADSKSILVYGVNGSGKSSFVDAIEYTISGKINHLSHEYSGSRQHKGIPNTHTPSGIASNVHLQFQDGSELDISIQPNGNSSRTGATSVASNWDYYRTVLRQDEMARFIHNTKGEKYSALVPLLGLGHLELAAENLRQLARAIEREASFTEERIAVRTIATLRAATFGGGTDEAITTSMRSLHAVYLPDNEPPSDGVILCGGIEAAIATKLAASSADQRTHVVLLEIANLEVAKQIAAVRSSIAKLGESAESLIEEKLAVLEKADVFIQEVPDGEGVPCPACGRQIAAEDFRNHVKNEQERLKDIIAVFDEHNAAVATLSDTVKSMKTAVAKPDARHWYAAASRSGLAAQCTFLNGTTAESLRETCGELEIKNLEDNILPLIEAAKTDSKTAPQDAVRLSDDKVKAGSAKSVLSSKQRADALRRAEVVCECVKALEVAARKEIRQKSQAIVEEISSDIRDMWGKLHPDKEITDIRLYLPEGADKAVDIGLRFFGVDQDSPRLTLSEGYRNSLGLCIFLAMAKREVAADTPLFLDDIVVSLDREHRGMVAQLLEDCFSDRQVILFTHDREWYTELRTLLNSARWKFQALLPYEAPDIGIRWSHKTTTFADARAQLRDRPDAAGNDARKIMDVELAIIAERLEISLAYRRGEKNDKRMAHEFLQQLISEGKRKFKKKDGPGYVLRPDVTDQWEVADTFLLAWGNRGSHSFDLVRPEATKLIDACEKAVESLTCQVCKKGVWVATHSNSLRCECGEIRWG